MGNFPVRSWEFGAWRKNRCTPNSELDAPYWMMILLALVLSGCIRMTGTAGYWKTGDDGETKAKGATFDTADYVPGSPARGSISSQ